MIIQQILITHKRIKTSSKAETLIARILVMGINLVGLVSVIE